MRKNYVRGILEAIDITSIQILEDLEVIENRTTTS